MPSTNGVRGTSLLASSFVLKYLQALRRDLVLRLRYLSRRHGYTRRKAVSFCAFVFCAILIFTSSLFLNWPLHTQRNGWGSHVRNGVKSHVHHAGLSVERLDCLCAKHNDGIDFASAFLMDAAFVARVRFIKTFSVSVRDKLGTANLSEPGPLQEQVSEFSVVTVLKGPLGAAVRPLLLQNLYARACVKGGKFLRPIFPPAADWLVVSGSLVNASSQLSIGNLFLDGASLLSPLLIPSPCSHNRKPRSNIEGARSAVRLYPWHSLPLLIRNHLLIPPVAARFSAAAWWRSSALVQPAQFGRYFGKVSKFQRTDANEAMWVGGRQWWIRDGVSMLAACKDRNETLSRALASWLRVKNVDEIILVDWTSAIPITQTLPKDLLSNGRVSITRVDGQVDWVLTRAYNVALQLASRSGVLKVDCDTWIAPDFVDAHPLNRDTFYAGDWTSIDAGPSNALHSNGILFATRGDLLLVGGYDERIVTYGWDDTDIVSRLSRTLTRKVLQYEKVRHIPHEANLRVALQKSHTLLSPSHPFAAAVEVQRNRLLTTRYGLPEWGTGSLRTVWNAGQSSAPTGKGQPKTLIQRMNAANDIPSLTDLVSTSDQVDVEKRAIRLILNRYGVPMLPKFLSLRFYRDYITRVAFPYRYAQFTVSVRGGCVTRIIALAVLRLLTSNISNTEAGRTEESDSHSNPSFVAPPSSYEGWRTLSVWSPASVECKCQHADLVHAVEEPVIPVWGDISNPLPSATEAHVDMRTLLTQYETLAKPINATDRTARWLRGNENETTNMFSQQLSLLANVKCGVNFMNLSTHQVDSLRENFRTVVLQDSITSLVAKSLGGRSMHILDLNTLSASGAFSAFSHQLLGRIVEVFNSSEVITLATKWSMTEGAGAVYKERQGESVMGRKLRYRARNVVIAIAMSETFNQITEQHSNSRISQFVTYVRNGAKSLLLGCPGPHTELLCTAPELAVVIAAIMSSDACR